MSRIKTMREKANMTQADLARAVGLKRSAVAMWETGGNMPNASKLPVIAKALNCTVDDLFQKERQGEK